MNIAKRIVTIALLIAIEIVLSRFLSISTPIMKIGFGFVPIVLAALLYGPLWAGAAGALADFIGAILFPIGGYFPGFTLTAGLVGVVFGLFLYKKPKSWVRTLCAVLIVCIVLSLGMNTYWLSVISGSDFTVLLATRLIQAGVMIPLQFVIIRILQSKRIYSHVDAYSHS